MNKKNLVTIPYSDITGIAVTPRGNKGDAFIEIFDDDTNGTRLIGAELDRDEVLSLATLLLRVAGARLVVLEAADFVEEFGQDDKDDDDKPVARLVARLRALAGKA